MRIHVISILLVGTFAPSVVGCSSDGTAASPGGSHDAGLTGSSGGVPGFGTGGTGARGGGSPSFGGQTLAGLDASTVIALCGTTGCACSNGKDDDGDGLIDGFDPECTGPLDNDEGSFATGIPGDNRDPKWQDCFFDGNSGAGDDGCKYATGCLTGDLSPTDRSCTLSQQCVDFCKPLAPNGCDCFGCCSLTAGGVTKDVLIGASCSLAKLGDETACPSCVKSTTCGNVCGECELCPGKTVADLPPSCAPADVPDGQPPPPAYTCPNGQAVCTETRACASGFYCQLGCCRPIIR